MRAGCAFCQFCINEKVNTGKPALKMSLDNSNSFAFLFELFFKYVRLTELMKPTESKLFVEVT
jgi:hypothetical protein